jgi:uncharacterized Zn-binding protein involved in type VI secretion
VPPISRIGDVAVGICCCHSRPRCRPQTGVIVSGAGTVLAGGAPVARIGDLVVAGCGHTGIIISGSGTVIVQGSPAARIGSSFTGCFTGTIVSGAGNVIAGG